MPRGERSVNPFLYLDRATPVHDLDPRCKLLVLAEICVLLLLFPHPLALLPTLIGLGVIVGIAGSLPSLRRLLPLLAILGGFSFTLWAVYAGGAHPLVWRVSRESLLYGLGVALKLDGMIVAGVLLLATTRNEELTQALVRLGLPYRIGFAFSVALRLVPTLIGVGATVVEAQRARGLDPLRGDPLARLRKGIPLLAPILLTTLRNANQLAMAMEARGFGAPGRTSLVELTWRRGDSAVAITASLLTLGGMLARRLGFGEIPGLPGP